MTRMPVAAVVARIEVKMTRSNERILMITINDDDANTHTITLELEHDHCQYVQDQIWTV